MRILLTLNFLWAGTEIAIRIPLILPSQHLVQGSDHLIDFFTRHSEREHKAQRLRTWRVDQKSTLS